MMRLNSKEGEKISIQMLISWQNLQGKQVHSLLHWQYSLLSRPTELDTKQETSPYGDGKLGGHVCVPQDSKATVAQKIMMQRMM
jgi:hypothetical protein